MSTKNALYLRAYCPTVHISRCPHGRKESPDKEYLYVFVNMMPHKDMKRDIRETIYNETDRYQHQKSDAAFEAFVDAVSAFGNRKDNRLRKFIEDAEALVNHQRVADPSLFEDQEYVNHTAEYLDSIFSLLDPMPYGQDLLDILNKLDAEGKI